VTLSPARFDFALAAAQFAGQALDDGAARVLIAEAEILLDQVRSAAAEP